MGKTYLVVRKDDPGVWSYIQRYYGRTLHEMLQGLWDRFQCDPTMDLCGVVPPPQMNEVVNFVVIQDGMVIELRTTPPARYDF